MMESIETFCSDFFFFCGCHRRRLEKKDEKAKVSGVKKPIVYYIDKTVPAEWRLPMKRGVENWQKAFEAAGYKNAIKAVLPVSLQILYLSCSDREDGEDEERQTHLVDGFLLPLFSLSLPFFFHPLPFPDTVFWEKGGRLFLF